MGSNQKRQRREAKAAKPKADVQAEGRRQQRARERHNQDLLDSDLPKRKKRAQKLFSF